MNPASKHSVVVVGARCAGAATALFLARAGHDVVMIDKGTPASDTNSTHSLVRGGVVQLARMGLLDDVLASGAPAIRSVSFQRYDDQAPPPVRLQVKAKAGVDLMLAPRRRVLDAIVADAAVAAGAVLLDRTTAEAVLRDERGRVTGVRVAERTGTGQRVRDLHADLVIGADGVRSRMAGRFGARTKERHAPSEACFYTYVGDVPWDGFEFHIADRAFAGVFPTHDEQACVWLFRPVADAAAVLSAGADRVDAWLGELAAAAPGLGRRVRSGSVRAPIRGAVALPNHVRQAAGPGWALVGDAGYHRDPITGHGMTDAFRDAELLAEAADAALRDPSREAAALAGYERERDAAVADTFRITRALGALPPPARFADLQVQLSRALDVEAEHLAARPQRAPAFS